MTPARRAWVAVALLVVLDLFMIPDFHGVAWVDGAWRGLPIDIMEHGARLCLVAIGAALVVATGGVDLGIGTVMALSGALAARLSAEGYGFPAVVSAAIGVGIAVGLMNAAMVVLGRMPPIVATLVPMVAGRGVAHLLAGGAILAVDAPWAVHLGSGTWLGMPLAVWVATGVIAVTALLLRRTAVGTGLAAVGSNLAACRIAGVPTGRLITVAYATSGAFAAIAGLLAAADVRSADAHSLGQFMELDAVVAVVIGGTAITGGVFSLGGALAGALFLQTLTVTLHAAGIRSDVAPLPKALLVLVAAIVAHPKFRLRRIRSTS
jgi:simple sugar transport system permease protein